MFKPDRVEFSANLAHPNTGTYLPIRVFMSGSIDPDDDPKEAWKYCWKNASDLAAEYGLIVVSIGRDDKIVGSAIDDLMSERLEHEVLLFSECKTKEVAELMLKTSEFKHHVRIKEIVQSLPSIKDGKKD